MTENDMAGWHHRLNGHESEPAPGDGEGQGSLPCYSLWGHKEQSTTQQLNNGGGWGQRHLQSRQLLAIQAAVTGVQTPW